MEKSDFSYIGWVPSINGHLDFVLIKPGIIGGFTNKKLSDSSTTLVNYPKSGKTNGHHRRVMMQSWVDWKDTPNDDNDGKSSRSQINDTDYASAVSDQAKMQILNEASLAMQSQKNQDYSNVLSLLR